MLQSNIRLVKDIDRAKVFINEKLVGDVTLETLKHLLQDDVTEVASYLEYEKYFREEDANCS